MGESNHTYGSVMSHVRMSHASYTFIRMQVSFLYISIDTPYKIYLFYLKAAPGTHRWQSQVIRETCMTKSCYINLCTNKRCTLFLVLCAMHKHLQYICAHTDCFNIPIYKYIYIRIYIYKYIYMYICTFVHMRFHRYVTCRIHITLNGPKYTYT